MNALTCLIFVLFLKLETRFEPVAGMFNDSGLALTGTLRAMSANPWAVTENLPASRGNLKGPASNPSAAALNPWAMAMTHSTKEENPETMARNPLMRGGTLQTMDWDPQGYRGRVQVLTAPLLGHRQGERAKSRAVWQKVCAR